MDQIVSAEDEAPSGTASSSSCKPLEDQKSLKQFTLREFFALAPWISESGCKTNTASRWEASEQGHEGTDGETGL